MTRLKLFSGTAHVELAKEICAFLCVPLGAADVKRFSDGEINVEIRENVRGVDVFIVQPTSPPVNDNLMELLILMDAFKRASARRVTAVIPYYGYARQDRKVFPRAPISAKLVADLLTAAGVSRILTVDLHAGQIQGFFNIPVDELTALSLLGNYFQAKQILNLTVVATDVGGAKGARRMADRLDAPLAIVEKRRIGNEERVEAMTVIGEVEGRAVLIVDDEVLTGGTLVATAEVVTEHGATGVYAAATHPILSGDAVERIEASPIKEMVFTDTIPLSPDKRLPNMTILSVAPLLGEAIRRIHTGQSVGALFNGR
ncbi:MAG TPA: ribose-phosphate pyrophosphokinase [Anaerolineales bacterium]|nr:ribose-phosphate pyrophosphokinase [Anaerolineales bacterium]